LKVFDLLIVLSNTKIKLLSLYQSTFFKTIENIKYLQKYSFRLRSEKIFKKT